MLKTYLMRAKDSRAMGFQDRDLGLLAYPGGH